MVFPERTFESPKSLSSPDPIVLAQDYAFPGRASDDVPIQTGPEFSLARRRDTHTSHRRASHEGDSQQHGPKPSERKRSFTLTSMGIKRDNTLGDLGQYRRPSNMQRLKSVAASRTLIFNTSCQPHRANDMSRIQLIACLCPHIRECLLPSPTLQSILHIPTLPLFSGHSIIPYITKAQETKLSSSLVRETRACVR